jgi:hypothetical protein
MTKSRQKQAIDWFAARKTSLQTVFGKILCKVGGHRLGEERLVGMSFSPVLRFAKEQTCPRCGKCVAFERYDRI